MSQGYYDGRQACGIDKFGDYGFMDKLGNVIPDEWFFDLWIRMTDGGLDGHLAIHTYSHWALELEKQFRASAYRYWCLNVAR